MDWPCEETTLDFNVDGYEVRLWITATPTTGQSVVAFWLERATTSLRGCASLRAACHDIATWGKPYGLSAVQVRVEANSPAHKYRIGHMIYTIRFDE